MRRRGGRFLVCTLSVIGCATAQPVRRYVVSSEASSYSPVVRLAITVDTTADSISVAIDSGSILAHGIARSAGAIMRDLTLEAIVAQKPQDYGSSSKMIEPWAALATSPGHEVAVFQRRGAPPRAVAAALWMQDRWPMTDPNLATYLNDHLAGAVAALELLDHLETAHAGAPVARALSELRTEIDADREVLQSLMTQLQVRESKPRKAAAWLAERLASVKLRLDDAGDGAFRLFESLEVVSLGIEGKLGLWRTLSAIAPALPDVGSLDYEKLMLRAAEQRERAEGIRLRAAETAFAGVSSST